METILRPPQWPAGLSNFVTWCLMWDPRNRPTSAEALNHEYFVDAIDPLRPKSSTSRLLGRKHSTIDSKVPQNSNESPPLSSKSSWFRKSFVNKDSSPAPPHTTNPTSTKVSSRPSPVHASAPSEPSPITKLRPFANKRATWTNGAATTIGAPMPILPSIRPISPFSTTVTIQAHTVATDPADPNLQHNSLPKTKASKKIGRQLSVASHGNHYGEVIRQDAERASNGQRDVTSPNGAQKEGFLSHLRKRARRLSGRPAAPTSPTPDDIEANAGCGGPWQSNRSSIVVDPKAMDAVMRKNPSEVDKALQSVRQSAEATSPPPNGQPSHAMNQGYPTFTSSNSIERHSSVSSQISTGVGANTGAISSRTRRALQLSTHPSNRYETPDEEDELLHEALSGAQKAVRNIDTWKGSQTATPPLAATDKASPQHPSTDNNPALNPYPTPSPSAKGTGVLFNRSIAEEPVSPLSIQITRSKEEMHPKCAPTPPPDDNEWATAAAASIFAAGSCYH